MFNQLCLLARLALRADLLHHRVGDGVQVHVALVRHVVEDIGGADGLRATLLVAKDQVYPLVQLTRHDLRLEGLRQRESQTEQRESQTEQRESQTEQRQSQTEERETISD